MTTNQSDGSFSIGGDVWPGTNKAIEEMGELLQVLGKLIGSSGNTAYWGGLDLRAKLVEEIADVLATIGFFCEMNLTIDEMDEIFERSEDKRAAFKDWHAQHRNHGAADGELD